MIDQLFILITALLFYILGRYSGCELETVRKISKQVRHRLNPPITGPIDYPSAEEINYEQSGEKKVDEAREKVFKEQFKL